MEGKEEGGCDGEEGRDHTAKSPHLVKRRSEDTPYMYNLEGKYVPVRLNE